MESKKCPVCGNPGIPNYLKENVICPHCGSDLTIYRTVSELSEKSNTSESAVKKYKILATILPLIAAIITIGAVFVFTPQKESGFQTQIKQNERIILQLRDSVSLLNAQIQKASKVSEINCFKYTIIPNDGPWRIVKKLYGNRTDWRKIAQKIAEDNGIWNPTTNSWKQIHPGQVLKINDTK
jgi:hypothetical protein